MNQQTKTSKTATTSPPDLKAETLSGDIRDWMLDQLRRVDKPWTKLSEGEQRRIIEGAGDMGRQAVRRALDIFLDYDFPTLAVSVGKYTGKDGTLKAEFTCQDTDANLVAVARAGRAVLVIAEPDSFFGEQQAAHPEPDQKAMDLDAAEAAGERVDPETGEIIVAGAPEDRLALPAPDPSRMPLDEAHRRFEAAKDKALKRKATREQKTQERDRTGEPADGQVDDRTTAERALERGREAFRAGRPGIVPDDLAGKPEQDDWLNGWDQESVASAKRRDAGAAMPTEPKREPAEA